MPSRSRTIRGVNHDRVRVRIEGHDVPAGLRPRPFVFVSVSERAADGRWRVAIAQLTTFAATKLARAIRELVAVKRRRLR